jgi:adenylosuccinate synthase
MSGVDYVDVVCGLAWGDEGKGKVTSHLTFLKMSMTMFVVGQVGRTLVIQFM